MGFIGTLTNSREQFDGFVQTAKHVISMGFHVVEEFEAYTQKLLTIYFDTSTDR